MTDTLKNLGQAIPAAATLATLYTVPSATSATASSLVVCNQSIAAGTFRFSHALSGAADTAAQYIYYEQSVPPYSTFVATIGLTLATTDVLRFWSSNGSMSANLYGVQIT